MRELKIRAVRSLSEEAESRIAVIDTFENVESDKPYFCSCEVFECRYDEYGKSIRGKMISKPHLENIDSINSTEACEDDVFEKVDIPLYLGLAQALKNDGRVFNKKLKRLFDIPSHLKT
jgi:hypothetical protein